MLFLKAPDIYTVILFAGNHVIMQMKNRLLRRLVVCVQNIHSVKAAVFHEMRGDFFCGEYNGAQRFVVAVKSICAVLFGDDKRMSPHVASNIQKSIRMLVLVNFVRRDFSLDNFTEYAILHKKPPNQLFLVTTVPQ